jgi:hypothetical protein
MKLGTLIVVHAVLFGNGKLREIDVFLICGERCQRKGSFGEVRGHGGDGQVTLTLRKRKHGH